MSKSLHQPTLRVVKIMNLVSLNGNLTLTEISSNLNIPKSTIQPILKTLINHDLLHLDESSKTYQIGIGAFRIGISYTTFNSTLELIKSIMLDIVQTHNEICQLGVFDNANPGFVFYIGKEEPTQSITLKSNIGSSLPAYSTALGKCLLSSYSDEQIRNLYKNGLTRITKNTISDINILLKELNDVRINNYAIELEESAPEIMCVAIPLFQNGKVVASLSVSLPMYRASKEKIESIKNTLLLKKKDIDIILAEKPLI